MRYFVTFPDGEEVLVDLDLLPTGEMEVVVGGQRIAAEVLIEPPAGSAVAAPLALRIDGRSVDLWMEGAPPDVGVIARGQRFYARVESDRDRALSAALGSRSAASEGLITSPMPGRVLKVLVEEGAEVTQGTALVVVEAMKMENELLAPRDGAVKKVFVVAGQTVEGGAKLLEIG